MATSANILVKMYLRDRGSNVETVLVLEVSRSRADHWGPSMAKRLRRGMCAT